MEVKSGVKLSSKVEMFLSASALPSLDTFSKSDPFAVIYSKDQKTQRYSIVGQTERIKNNEYPVWTKRFVFDYFFEETQEFLVELYDSDDSAQLTNLGAHDYMGQCSFTLADVVAARGQRVLLSVRNRQGQPVNGGRAQLLVRVEELRESSEFVRMSVSGRKLEKMDFFGKSDPFLQFLRHRDDNSWVLAHQTEVTPNTLNPDWKEFTLPVSTICNGDYKRPILVKCFDWNKKSDPEYMGEFEATVADMIGPFFNAGALAASSSSSSSTSSSRAPARVPTSFNLGKRDKSGKLKAGKGQIVFNKVEVYKEASFIDYLRGGMSIGLMVAIDYTGSNGDPAQSDSLHYRYGQTPNQYVQAISSVGSVLTPYDTDKKYPVWGFGGIINNKISHCFPVTLDPNNQEVYGVEGILNAYYRSMNYVTLAGPTYFAEVVQTAMSIASRPMTQTDQVSNQHYDILLIITDGEINDMERTKSAVIQASNYPLSIVIVGVGSADFKKMEALDSDNGLLSDGRSTALRDIVQFVPMRNFTNKHISLLAKETLAEIPGQVLDYMKRKRISPNRPLEYVSSSSVSTASAASAASSSSVTMQSAAAYPQLATTQVQQQPIMAVSMSALSSATMTAQPAYVTQTPTVVTATPQYQYSATTPPAQAVQVMAAPTAQPVQQVNPMAQFANMSPDQMRMFQMFMAQQQAAQQQQGSAQPQMVVMAAPAQATPAPAVVQTSASASSASAPPPAYI